MIAIALFTVTACGSGAQPATAKHSIHTPSAPTVSTSDLLLTTADLPNGFTQFTSKKAPRAFCGQHLSTQPIAKTRATFVKPARGNVIEIRDTIATFASATAARRAFEEGRSLIRTTCHLDVSPLGRDLISLDPSPPFGADSMSITQVVTGTPPIQGVNILTTIAHTYYVLDGSSIIDVGVADALLEQGGTGMATTSDLPLLKELTQLQLKRFDTKTPAPGISA